MPIDISGIDKDRLFLALYEAAKSVQMDYPWPIQTNFKIEEARLQIAAGEIKSFAGKILHINISGNDFEPDSYDQHNGQGKAQEAVNSVRQEAVAI